MDLCVSICSSGSLACSNLLVQDSFDARLELLTKTGLDLLHSRFLMKPIGPRGLRQTPWRQRIASRLLRSHLQGVKTCGYVVMKT